MPGELLKGIDPDLLACYEQVDWAATPLGPVDAWRGPVRETTRLALHTQFPVSLFWGPELVLVYNAAYVPLIADKHPAGLGRPGQDVFPEAWDQIGPLFDQVLAGGGAVYQEDALVPLWRRGGLEESYFTFSYSPVFGPDGAVVGVMNIASETTTPVIDRRRLATLGRLRDVLADLERPEDLRDRALPILLAEPRDVPEADVLLPGDTGSPVLPAAPLAGRACAQDADVTTLALGAPARGGRPPTLVVRTPTGPEPDPGHPEFLRLVAAALEQALDRLAARDGERRLSDTLQRSLLPRVPALPGVEVAVRYRPAAAEARIGGDWYDAFRRPDGTSALVIGDVAGHDQLAAAAMAQVRNLLRGVAAAAAGSPASILKTLDQAMAQLEVDAAATAILAAIEPRPGGHVVRWSNAGHPPPVLRAPDGRARLLTAAPDVLLGFGDGARQDHVTDLVSGSTLVLYTDGLVERRGAPLDQGLGWLCDVIAAGPEGDAEAVADHVLGTLDGPVEDDVALLVLRTRAA